ncbi:MAG: 16S rRNA (cytidine(1402)-2'-O)-methyltransferase [bacterium]
MSNGSGVLYVVATPIGNREDISARALRILREEVDVIAAEDTRHSRRLLQQHGITTPLIPFHEHNENRLGQRVLERLLNGESIALVSDAGTPLISDPGFDLVRRCRGAGVAVSPLPGPSALIAALSVSGLPTDSFLFDGFLPRTHGARLKRLQWLAEQACTVVFYESSHRILDCLRDLRTVLDAERPLFIAREISKQFEDLRLGTVAELLIQVEQDPNMQRGELVLVFAGKRLQESGLDSESERILKILCDALPVKQAAALTAEISGLKKNLLYQKALELKKD